MAVISSPLRIRAVPEIPMDDARLCNSGKSIAESPVPPRRRFVAVAVPASATSVTPDVTSVVSLNGFLPSKKPRSPGSAAWWPSALGPASQQCGAGLQHGSSTVSDPSSRRRHGDGQVSASAPIQ
jgi:hypothetical protein